MTTKKFILINLILVPTIFFFIFCFFSGAEVLKRVTTNGPSRKIDISKYLSRSDTLFVIHFHPTVQCSCCISVGNFAKKGLEKFYAKPYKDSLIIFREYNIDEDSSTSNKYKIFWSALGFEKFCGEKKEFKEIESVWEFCENEENFLLNFRKELDEFIISSKKTKSKAGDTKQDMAKPNGKPQSDFQEKKLR